ncbi:hypothetical protein V6N12_032258 [Hibiscus sabdariffa]|uniref:Uncharacterized protein n=1 Tax=Hibiscus sabdariffa TaxID=183260 RepID=A0ABR2CE15_9ROSI
MGVQPSNTPQLIDTLLATARAYLGVDPEISCRSVGGRRYLTEFRLCFERATPPIQLRNCPNPLVGACVNPQLYVLIP